MADVAIPASGAYGEAVDLTPRESAGASELDHSDAIRFDANPAEPDASRHEQEQEGERELDNGEAMTNDRRDNKPCRAGDTETC